MERLPAVRCSHCGRDGNHGRFCEGCGSPLPRSCPSCGSPVSDDARFCGGCGVALDAGSPAVAAPADEGAVRQLAVLFCDLVGSTPLSQRMDLEDYGEEILGFQQLVVETIAELGGTIGSFAGDGVFAYFGWPAAHEDDAELAVRAARRILDGIEERNRRPRDVTLAARAGVHVGPVVLRRMPDGKDTPAFGATVNVASRVEGAAEPGTIVVTETAQRLVASAFVTTPQGTRTLKGVGPPMALHRVERERDADEPRAVAFSAPMVARDSELAVLLGAWAAARLGVGRTVVITGEPGVGKSRLLHTMREALTNDPHRWLELRCSPLSTNTPLHPVAGLVRQTLGLRREDPPDEQWARLRAATSEEAAAVLGRLLHLEGGPADELPPEQLRLALMTSLRGWLLDLARERPLVLVGEDLHWADPSTLELVRALQQWAVTAPVLIAVTHRDDSELDLPEDAQRIRLERLDAGEARRLAEHLARERGLSEETIERVAARADGVPLFIEELVAAAEMATDGAADELPSSLQSALLARLDRLGPGRDVAQLGAVLGRAFPHALLAAVAPYPPRELDRQLDRLTAAGLLESIPASGGPRHQFRHALIRDAAYASLLKHRRAELHRQVAQTLESAFPEIVAREPELLGHHLAAAGDPLRAAAAFEHAGRRAARSAALEEAAAHYRRGIELLGRVEAGRERDRRLMWLDVLLANAMMGSDGIGAEAIRPVWEEAIALGDDVGDADELTAALNGLAVYHCDAGDLAAAIELARRQIAIGERDGSRYALLRGHGTLGMALFYRGEGRRAVAHLRASLARYEAGDFAVLTFGVGHDQGIFARSMLAWARWWLGCPDAALREATEAVEEAEQLGSFLSLAMARQFLSLVRWLRREHDECSRLAEANASFSHELRFPFWEGLALMQAGASRALRGDRTGLEVIGQAVTILARAGNRSGTTSGLAMIAEAQRAAGDPETALKTVEGALAFGQAYPQAFWDAELLRLKAELSVELDAATAPAAAELLHTAYADARARGAASFALRAATSLVRLAAGTAEEERARDMLAAALDAMGDGEATPDVLDARALTTIKETEIR